jgi:hypothetical protein
MILGLRRYGLASLLCCVVASLTAGAAGARAQAPGVTGPVTAPAGTAAAASAEPAPTTAAAGAQLDSDMDPTVEVAAPVASSSVNRGTLEKRLHDLETERAHWTNFWPWLVVGTGAGMVLTGAVVGAESTFSCEPDTACQAPPWATLVVVIGVAIGTVGTIWLVRTDAGIRELEIQTKRVRMDLEQLDHARLMRDRGFAKLSSAPLNLRLAF